MLDDAETLLAARTSPAQDNPTSAPEIAEPGPDVGDRPTTPPDPLHDLVRDDEIVVCYHVGFPEVIMWVVTRDRVRTEVLPVSATELAGLVEEATGDYRAGGSGAEATARTTARTAAWQRLGRVLLVEQALSAGDPSVTANGSLHRLVIVPDGRLAYLPFSPLPLPGGGVLADRAVLSYAPSLNVLARLRGRPPSRAQHPFVAFADPVVAGPRSPSGAYPAARRGGVGRSGDADDGASLLLPAGHELSPLPGTGREAEAVAAIVGPLALVLTGPRNTAARVRAEAPRHRVVHFATHSLLDEVEAGFSGLVVSPPIAPTPGEGDEDLVAEEREIEDLVTVHELEALCLDADLVVCSACQTGLGVVRAGEGVVGMARALLAAGARCVVMSLWPVPDLPARRLMTSFYRALLSGMSVAAALHRAEQETRAFFAGAEDSTVAWSGFVVIGDGDRSPAFGAGAASGPAGQAPACT
jgi:CHAT domain-containing protein